MRHKALQRGAPAVVAGLVVLIGSFSAARAAGGCTQALARGSHLVQIKVGSTNRVALVHVPAGVGLPSGRRSPLVLALHGWGSSGPKMESYSGFSRLADRDRFIVAYPSSDGVGWNSTGSRKLPDDVAFLSALIRYVQARSCVDPRQVYATGVSNGGGMAALAGCELSSQIAAIAPVAGDYGGQPRCSPALPLSMLEIHGTADQVAAYFGAGGRRTEDGVPPFVNSWASRDGCAAGPSSRRIAPRTTLFQWRGCTSGVAVEHIQIRGGRHQWPGATPPDPGPRATICASCTIWSFFKGLRGIVRSWSTGGGAGFQ